LHSHDCRCDPKLDNFKLQFDGGACRQYSVIRLPSRWKRQFLFTDFTLQAAQALKVCGPPSATAHLEPRRRATAQYDQRQRIVCFTTRLERSIHTIQPDREPCWINLQFFISESRSPFDAG
jgi:hypothetical protein